MNYWPTGVGVIKTEGTQSAVGRTHHIWIEDQSGSMSWAVDQVADDMIKHLKDIPPSDIISIGYFSGVGDYRWFVIGYGLNTQDNYDRIAKLIRENARARNTTCFSEILTDLSKVIGGSSALADSVNLVFLTDGHPVVPSLEVERRNIFKAITDVKSNLASVLIVGYGDYYNRSLLAEMAAAFGGALQHADRIEQFGKELGNIVLSKSKKRITIKLPDGANIAFTVGKNGSISLYQIDSGNVAVPEGTTIYFTTSKPEPVSQTNEDDGLKAAYASALAMNKSGNTDEALKKLSEIGDVALVTALANALTNAEIGVAEQKIQDAVVSQDKRFISGHKIGCLPKDDAFDLLDLLTLLQSDKNACFYPYHPAFDYKRIGRKSETVGDYPKFEPDMTQGVPFSDLVWSSDELNLSVRAQIKGRVTFTDAEKAMSVGFAAKFPTMVFRNYALVANCYPNVRDLPVDMSILNWDKLDRLRLFEPNNVPMLLHLDRLPVCNRAKSSVGYSAKSVATDVVMSTMLAAKINALNAIRKELDPQKEILKATPYTPEQEAFLNDNGIFSGLYNPPTKQAEATDTIGVRVFDIKVAKFSSFPKLDEVRKQSTTGRFTPSGLAVWNGVLDFDTNAPKSNLETTLKWIDAKLSDLKQQRSTLQQKINFARFAMALGNRWFTDLPTRQDNTVVVGVEGTDYTVTFDVKEVQKKI